MIAAVRGRLEERGGGRSPVSAMRGELLLPCSIFNEAFKVSANYRCFVAASASDGSELRQLQ